VEGGPNIIKTTTKGAWTFLKIVLLLFENHQGFGILISILE
jgi:hypothetical protein